MVEAKIIDVLTDWIIKQDEGVVDSNFHLWLAGSNSPYEWLISAIESDSDLEYQLGDIASDDNRLMELLNAVFQKMYTEDDVVVKANALYERPMLIRKAVTLLEE